MGRTRNDVIRSAFDYDRNRNQSKCKVHRCKAIFAGSYLTNLSRHLKMKHPTMYGDLQLEFTDEEVQKKPRKRLFQLATSEEEVKNACLHAVTVEGKPLSYFDDLSFRTFAEPIFKALKMNTINSHNVTSILEEKFELMIKNLKKITSWKLIPLKIDSVTRHGKKSFCVSMQVVIGEKIQIFTLGIITIMDRATAEHLSAEIKKILNRFCISEEQIFSVTSDNDRNVIRTEKTLREGDNETKGDDDDWMVEIADTLRFGAVPTVRCAPHILQLAVEDFLRAPIVGDIISAVRALVKHMGAPNRKRLVRKRPILDVPTSWITTYDMLKSFKELRPVWTESCSAKFSEEDLAAVDSLLEVLLPVKSVTLQLQREQLPLGDFMKVWWGLRLSLEMIEDKFIEEFLGFFGEQEKLLMDNDMVLAALYLDPRLRTMFPHYKTASIRRKLKKIAAEMMHVKRGSPPSSPTIQPAGRLRPSTPASPLTRSDSLLDSFLSSMDTGSSDEELDEDDTNATTDQELGSAALEIQSYNPGRLPLSLNILEYWEEQRFAFPVLSAVARVVHSVPVTQVSVDRYLSTENSFNTSDKFTTEQWEKLMLVKLNESI